VSDLFNHPSFPSSPTSSTPLTQLKSSTVGDDFGSVIEAWFAPLKTDRYRFIVRQDDATRVLVFTTPGVQPQSDAEMQIMVENTCCGRREGTVSTLLEAGESYFIRAYLKEAKGFEFLEVGVIGEESNEEIFPIPSDLLGYIAPPQERFVTPTTDPTATPTSVPSAAPTAEPTATPTAVPTATPTEFTGELRCGSTRGCISFYENIEGNDVADLFNAAKFPSSPDSLVELQGELTTPRGRGDNYGVRWRRGSDQDRPEGTPSLWRVMTGQQS